MTPKQKAKLVAAIQALRAVHREKDRAIAKTLRIVLKVLDPKSYAYADSATLAKIRKDKAELPAVLRDMITMLEKEDNIT
jgi:hypothetical protein